MPGDEGEVGRAGAEECSEKCEGTGSRAGQRAARRAGRAGRDEGSEVVRSFAADEADRHSEYAERDEDADRGRAVAKL